MSDIAVFVGQGVQVEGRYGVISRIFEEDWLKRDEVPPKPKSVEVYFHDDGQDIFVPVQVEELERAEMPEAELQQLYAKHYPEFMEMEEAA